RYDRVRDELTANLEKWLRDGGSLPEDVKLAGELHEPEWEIAINGRNKVTRKTELKKALGRSPDRYDAVALSAWEPASVRAAESDDADDDAPSGAASDLDAYEDGAIDPYGAQ